MIQYELLKSIILLQWWGTHMFHVYKHNYFIFPHFKTPWSLQRSIHYFHRATLHCRSINSSHNLLALVSKTNQAFSSFLLMPISIPQPATILYGITFHSSQSDLIYNTPQLKVILAKWKERVPKTEYCW